MSKVSLEDINRTYEKMKKEIEEGGYNFNPVVEDTKAIIEGLLVNESRYGYMSCPCRLGSGIKSEDLDIICPCDYRDPDLEEYNACFCSLFVSRNVIDGKVKIQPVPERRPSETKKKEIDNSITGNLKYPVWRCRVCGYICAREKPPEKCPICKAEKERFERFM
jgi:ferredoxin-thioredoxin reductase catalytic chain